MNYRDYGEEDDLDLLFPRRRVRPALILLPFVVAGGFLIGRTIGSGDETAASGRPAHARIATAAERGPAPAIPAAHLSTWTVRLALPKPKPAPPPPPADTTPTATTPTVTTTTPPTTQTTPAPIVTPPPAPAPQPVTPAPVVHQAPPPPPPKPKPVTFDNSG